MTQEELAQKLGFEKVKGKIITAKEQTTSYDIFIKEDELEECWYNETMDLAYPNTKEGLKRLCNDAEY